jgi:dTDP-L-rhamnose 4-epimerase
VEIKMKILITGGAGFIGSHLADQLLKDQNNEVTIFDILEKQVHNDTSKPPSYLNEKANFILGSVTDYEKFKRLFIESDIIFHLAAMVGVSQSMYQIRKYTKHNILGIGNLMDLLVNTEHNVKKLIIASSNTIYGEGKYKCTDCGIVYPPLRSEKQLMKKNWDLHCSNCNAKIEPLFTDELTPFNPSSIYAFSKEAQERMAMMIGDTYGINTSVLRFFLVYGPRQSINNPYTDVCGIFASRAFSGKAPLVFEDGNQMRDFVHVSDICQGLTLAMKSERANDEIFNVGTGNPISINKVAEIICNKINPEIKPKITNTYRVGDIRHCIADISKIKSKLGYEPRMNFQDGIETFINWINHEDVDSPQKSKDVMKELEEKNLLKE